MTHAHEVPVLVANPSFDLYGADLQMLESVAALVAAGRQVTVVSPTDGPLRERLHALGAATDVLPYPVLRRADASSAARAARLGAAGTAAAGRIARYLRARRPCVLYVNTITLPWWLLAGKVTRTPTLCHVHEAEPNVSRAVGRAMTAPLLLADLVLANSEVSRVTLCTAQPRLTGRTRLVYNGVEGPPAAPEPAAFPEAGARLLFVGRLSPRKAPHVALETAARLRAAGRPVTLVVAGTPVDGQEDYAEDLVRRAQEPDLAGAVTFPGYVSPVWPALADCDVFLATSTAEPFGNAVVEAQLARRPVVATAVEGHLETVRDGVTGLHVPVGDVDAFTAATTRLVDDPEWARALADDALRNATEHFGTQQYREAIVQAIVTLVTPPTSGEVRPS